MPVKCLVDKHVIAYQNVYSECVVRAHGAPVMLGDYWWCAKLTPFPTRNIFLAVSANKWELKNDGTYQTFKGSRPIRAQGKHYNITSIHPTTEIF